MPHQEPTMPEQPATPFREIGDDHPLAGSALAADVPPDQPPAGALAADSGGPALEEDPTAAQEPFDDHDEWLDEPEEARRPRRRLLTPLPLALAGVLLIACGFIGGVLVEKGESSSSSAAGSSGSGLAARFAALRGGAAGAGTGSTAATGASSRTAAAGGFTRPTAGTVAYLDGPTLYVTDAEGNTVKVSTSPATTVTKSVKADVTGIHPGETVTVTGATGANGAVTAESISVGATGGGLGALFGRGGGSSSTGGSSSSSSGAVSSLFGG